MNPFQTKTYFRLHEAAAAAAGINPAFVRYNSSAVSTISLSKPDVIFESDHVSKEDESAFYQFYEFLLRSYFEKLIELKQLPLTYTTRIIGEAFNNGDIDAIGENENIVSEYMAEKNIIFRSVMLSGYLSERNRLYYRYFEKEDIQTLFKNGNIHDKYFNPKPEVDAPEATTPEPEERKLPLIKWIAPDVDFTCLIDVLLRRKYIEASDLSEALRIAAPYFDGINNRTKTLIQGKNNRLKTNKFDVIPENKSKKRN